MQKLLASDVIYEQVVRPEVDSVLAANGISDSDLPKSTFLADEKWLEESTVSDALGGDQRRRRGPSVSGVHGTEIAGVTVNGTELIEGAPTTIAGRRRRRSRSQRAELGRIDRERGQRRGHATKAPR